jgi:hypothetical protein
MTRDRNLEIARLQQEIANHIGVGPDSLMFNYVEKAGDPAKLYLITLNPRHNQSFLFHSTEGVDKLEALREMLDYVRTYKERTSSYTIQWSARTSAPRTCWRRWTNCSTIATPTASRCSA